MVDIRDGKLFVNGLPLAAPGTESLSSTQKSKLLATDTTKIIDPRDGVEVKVQITAYKKA